MSKLSGEYYYIRFRGQVSGPAAVGELGKMVQRGALSRLHEISTDQIDWQAAGRFDELFYQAQPPPPPVAPPPPPLLAPLFVAPPAPGEEQFYYSHKSATIGPITAPLLAAQVQRGNLRANDLVWREGSPAATMAGQLDFLRRAFADAPARRRIDGAKILLFAWILAVTVAAVMVLKALLWP